ncbi:hypothetical protein CC86DRAFT_409046 [Ophiobolus disseminans]|uniref:Uncharacterized protein n=1 Tax=Ophiobolus disseminans TaxID=1469910 RepID=A0A6A6ZUA6_9PLEO|nr:hypothetical protein CC86DRAFT_409046 [Ophiobolus disseminans]
MENPSMLRTVHATAWAGIPISVGPEGKWKRKSATTENSSRAAEFVFAYRVRGIKVRRKGGVKAHRQYDKGALFNNELKRIHEEETEVDLLELNGDVDGDEFDLECNQVKQECDDVAGEVICVMPEEF